MNRPLQAALTRYIEVRAKECGIDLDVYDPTALLTIVQEFLKAHDAALTGTGVRKFRR